MIRLSSVILVAAAFAAPALSHFVFIVPQDKGVQVVFSDDLEPDEGVSIEKITGVVLAARDVKANETPVKAAVGKHSLTMDVPKETRFVFGNVDYGVMQKGKASPYLLRYHAKVSLGDVFDGKTVGAKLPLEIVPVGGPGRVRFQALVNGKPLPAAEFTIMPAGAERKKLTADADGLSPPFAAAGRYGVWTKFIDKTPGEIDGKKFDETRHYSTLVVDVAAK